MSDTQFKMFWEKATSRDGNGQVLTETLCSNNITTTTTTNIIIIIIITIIIIIIIIQVCVESFREVLEEMQINKQQQQQQL